MSTFILLILPANLVDLLLYSLCLTSNRMAAQKVQQHPVVIQAQNKLGYYHDQLDKEVRCSFQAWREKVVLLTRGLPLIA